MDSGVRMSWEMPLIQLDRPVGPGGVPHLLGLPEPLPEEQKGQSQHTADGQKKEEHKPQGDLEQNIHAHGHVVLPHAPLGGADHQQAVLPHPALDRVVVQIPPGEGGHVGEGVLLGHVRRLPQGPGHLPVRADEHGPALLS